MENPFALMRLAATYLVERWRHDRDPVSLGFDAEFGVDTHAWTLSGYEPTPVRLLEEVVAGLPAEGATFFDLGCGKGRVLLVAARHPFRRVVGVEHDEGLSVVARRNLRHAVDPLRRCHDVEVITLDAADLSWPLEPLVVFLYNPFPREVVARVTDALGRSLTRHPRPCRVVYVHPLFVDELLARGWEALTDAGDGPERVVQLGRPS